MLLVMMVWVKMLYATSFAFPEQLDPLIQNVGQSNNT